MGHNRFGPKSKDLRAKSKGRTVGKKALCHASTNLLFLASCLLMITVPFHSFAVLEDDTASTTEEELYQQCKQAFSEGTFTEANQHIARFLSLYPESDHAAEILFMQVFLQPDIDTSVEMYRLIIEKYPDSEWIAKSHFQLGQCYYLQGKYDEALNHYGKIIISYPEDETYWPARYWRCRSFIAKGDYEKAVTMLRSLDNSSSEETSKDMILMSLGDCYRGMQDYERAAALYRSLIESMSDSHWVGSACLLLAKSLHDLGALEEAKTFYQELVEDHPQSIEAQQAQKYLDSLASTQPKHIEAQDAVPGAIETTRIAPETVGAMHASPVKTASYFSIQVGAFSKKRNAEKLASKLKKKGYSVAIVAPSPGKSSLYKVRIGKFKTRSAALKAARRLGKNERLDTEVVPQSTAPD